MGAGTPVHICAEQLAAMASVMNRQERTMTEEVCWVALTVAVSTLAVLLWLFD